MANFTINVVTGEVTVDKNFVAPSFDVGGAVPSRVTARQARLALDAAGLLNDVEAAIAASSRQVQLTWEYATEIERANPVLAQVAAGFGFTDAQMDDLFRQAAAL